MKFTLRIAKLCFFTLHVLYTASNDQYLFEFLADDTSGNIYFCLKWGGAAYDLNSLKVQIVAL